MKEKIMQKDIRAYVNNDILLKVKKQYPEVKGLSATGLVDWALRKILKEA